MVPQGGKGPGDAGRVGDRLGPRTLDLRNLQQVRVLRLGRAVGAAVGVAVGVAAVGVADAGGGAALV